MWGNFRGWMISALIAALTVAWVWFIATRTGVTPPTAFARDPQNLAALDLPTIESSQRVGGDAGEHYRAAVGLYLKDRALYEDFANRGSLSSPAVAKLKAIDHLIEAATAKPTPIFAPRPQTLINYGHDKPAIEALQMLGRVCIDRLGLLNQRAGKAEEAKKFYQAGLALGESLANERLTYDELQIGLEMRSKAAHGLGLGDFEAAQSSYATDRITPMLRVIRSIDPNVIGQHTGDLFVIARDSRERMWRVEAILALGRVRYLAGAGGTGANQRAATALVRQLAESDADPIVRAAAEAARDLTIEQHRSQ